MFEIEAMQWTISISAADCFNQNLKVKLFKTSLKRPKPTSGKLDRATGTNTVALGSISGQVKPMTIKIEIYSLSI